jgi:hypothetical protein
MLFFDQLIDWRFGRPLIAAVAVTLCVSGCEAGPDFQREPLSEREQLKC